MTIPAGGTRYLQVSGYDAVPGGAAAVMLNVTTINTTAAGWLTVYPADIAEPPTTVGTAAVNVTVISPAGSGYLTVYPDGDPQPGTSNLNYPAGQTRAQLSVTKLGGSGRLPIYASTRVNVIVDGQGWYTVAGADSGSTYTATNPVRVVDTRSASRAGQCATTAAGATLLANCTTLAADAVRYVQITGQQGVPAGVKAVAVNLTATTTAAAGYLIAWPAAALLEIVWPVL